MEKCFICGEEMTDSDEDTEGWVRDSCKKCLENIETSYYEG